MRVKRLELLGFKSFPSKTSIVFEPGVTAVVGPNGSGKTNLVDAIRWVLGEHNPRDVRAPRLEDVIFNGTDTQAPLSMAEVSLTIENNKGLLPLAFTEVLITRRVYRSGESECLINNSPCRLKDIQELFLGTGLGGGTYAIIEQGHIDLVLSSKPEERRAVFEEASGIAKYLAKKQETLRRLDEVEADLVRVADIIAEVRRQQSSLERQASKARQYKTQWETLKGLELRVAADTLRQGEDIQQQLKTLVESLTHKQAALDEEKQRLLASFEAAQACVSKTQTRLQELQVRQIEAANHIEQQTTQMDLKSRWAEELAEQRRQLEAETSQVEERLAQLGTLYERLSLDARELESRHNEQLALRGGAAGKRQALDQGISKRLEAIEEAKGRLFEAASNASQQRNTLASVTLRLQTVEAQTVRSQEQRSAAQQRLDALTQRRQQLQLRQKDLRDQLQALQAGLDSACQSVSQGKAQCDQLIGRANGLREQLSSQRAKVELLEGMYRRYEGCPEAAKTLLSQPPDGAVGLLGDLLDAQSGYELALEAALGPLSAAIVVQDRCALKRCQELILRHGLDGCYFVVLSDCPSHYLTGFAASEPPLTGSPSTSSQVVGPSHVTSSDMVMQEGFLGSLKEFVSFDPAYHPLVECLLGGWNVVDDMSRLLHATAAVRGNWVSLAGDRWDGQSWKFAGRIDEALGHIGRKKTWEEARQELEALERDATSAETARQEAQAQWQSFVVREEKARQAVQGSVESLAGLDSELAQIINDQIRLEEELKTHGFDQEELAREQNELIEAKRQADQAVAEAQASHQHAEDALKDLLARQEEERSSQQQCAVSIAQLEAAIASCGERQAAVRARIDEVQTEQAQLAGRIEGKQTQVSDTVKRLAELAEQLEGHRKEAAALDLEQARLKEEIERLSNTLREEERLRDQALPNLLAVEKELLSLTQTLKGKEIELAERSSSRARIAERLREVYRLEESDLAAEQQGLPALSEEERKALADQINRLKAKLDAIGPVSLGSVEEYEELGKRLEFLKDQQVDLLQAKSDLRDSISRINRTARTEFRQTFAKIREEFQRYFARLFGGGQADLILLDEDDVLESGIEIAARPPGKRLQSISLLSGGERALTAIALLFALFEVRPSPFCVLDEIDAPLDEANIDRFTKVLEDFLSLSQFILITHNKKTITKADCLYGVTMEQPGISKLVSVKLTKGRRPASSPPAETPAQADAVAA